MDSVTITNKNQVQIAFSIQLLIYTRLVQKNNIVQGSEVFMISEIKLDSNLLQLVFFAFQ